MSQPTLTSKSKRAQMQYSCTTCLWSVCGREIRVTGELTILPRHSRLGHHCHGCRHQRSRAFRCRGTNGQWDARSMVTRNDPVLSKKTQSVGRRVSGSTVLKKNRVATQPPLR